MTPRLTDSRLANVGAKTILRQPTSRSTKQFRTITGAPEFGSDTQDWPGLQADTAERLASIGASLTCRGGHSRPAGRSGREQGDWASMKAVCSGLITDRDIGKLAETFFNSATRRIFTTVGVDPQIEFVATDFETPTQSRSPVYRSYNRISIH